MTPSFFSTGFFYSRGLQVKDGSHVLSQTLNVPYHLPLPKKHRNPDGDYKLGPDMGTEGILGRFFSKLDFANRPKQFRTLKSEVAVTEKNGAFELAFTVDGQPNVPVTIELGFRTGGKFTGTEPMSAAGGGGGGRGRGGRGGGSAPDAENASVLKQGMGTYTVGNDTIDFGPGQLARPPGRMEGETYGWINGSLRAEGDRVYLTGITPFRYTLTIK
jgi:hypothetical protein